MEGTSILSEMRQSFCVGTDRHLLLQSSLVSNRFKQPSRDRKHQCIFDLDFLNSCPIKKFMTGIISYNVICIIDLLKRQSLVLCNGWRFNRQRAFHIFTKRHNVSDVRRKTYYRSLGSSPVCSWCAKQYACRAARCEYSSLRRNHRKTRRSGDQIRLDLSLFATLRCRIRIVSE